MVKMRDGDNNCTIKVKADYEGISRDERRKAARKLAGAITHALRSCGEVSVRCFGYASIGKGAKALAIAREFMAEHGLSMYCAPAFIDADMDDGHRTGLCYASFSEEGVVDIQEKMKSAKELRVKSDPTDMDSESKKVAVRQLAGSVANALREVDGVQVRCIGMASIGKAVKALAIARGFVAVQGRDLYCTPVFIDAEIQGEERTGIAFFVFTGG